MSVAEQDQAYDVSEDIAGLRRVKVSEAKTHLSRLIEAVEAGERVVIARGSRTVAVLSPLPPRTRRPGGLLSLMDAPSADRLVDLMAAGTPEDEIAAAEGAGKFGRPAG